MPLYQHQQTEVHRFQNPVRVKRLIAYFVTVLYTMYFEKVLELEKWFHKYSESNPSWLILHTHFLSEKLNV